MARIALTTFDNPFDPFEQFDSWLLFDKEHNHNCCELVAQFARTSDQLSDEEDDAEIERAIDEIIKYDFTNTYKKVKEQT